MNIFSSIKQHSIAQYSETELIKKIQEKLGSMNPPYPMGIGDDCAVLPTFSTSHFLATTDSVIVHQHFFPEDPPSSVGAKLLKRNLSDIAAMGGSPTQALLAIIAGSNTSFEWFQEFIRGIKDTATLFNTQLVGGDLSAGPDSYFSATMTLLGETSHPILRKTSQCQDHFFVTGSLGGSILGHHLSFTPRLREGYYLSQHSAVHAMIDLSDGIAKDLPELLPAHTAAHLILENIPLSEAALILSKETNHSPLYHALCDGEDYELLFTVDSQYSIEGFIQEWKNQFTTPLAHLGTIAPAPLTDKNPFHFYEKGKKWNPPFAIKGFEYWKQ